MCPWSCRGRFRCKGIVYGGCGRIPHFSFVKTLAQFALGLWTIFSTSSSYLAATRDWMNPLVCQSTAGFGRISQFLRGLSPRCSHIISTSSSYGGLEWGGSAQHQQQQYNLVRLRFNRRGAFTPLWGVKSCSLPSKWPNPLMLSRPRSSGHLISMEHRIRRKHLQFMKVIQPGIRLLSCSLLRRDSPWGDRAENCVGSAVAAFAVLGQGCLHARWCVTTSAWGQRTQNCGGAIAVHRQGGRALLWRLGGGGGCFTAVFRTPSAWTLSAGFQGDAFFFFWEPSSTRSCECSRAQGVPGSWGVSLPGDPAHIA